jgi:hypothetical protein
MKPSLVAAATPLRRFLLGTLLALATILLSPRQSQAVEVQCIEASKYKYLFHIFGGDRAKFADYLGVDPARLPEPDMCRAILVTGRIEPSKRGSVHEDPDFSQLAHAIVENRGWLAAVYLSSPGGTVGTAMRLAMLTRMFWLKSYAPGATFLYTPDFLASSDIASAEDKPTILADLPDDLLAGWRIYRQMVEAQVPIELASGPRGRCTSACTYLLAAGVDRHGTPYVHRGRRVAGSRTAGAEEPALADLIEVLQRSEAHVAALYRHMDAGEEVVRLYQSTSTAAVSPAFMPRSPRFIADHLRRTCKADINVGFIPHRGQVEKCVAMSHEKERLRQYAKWCGDNCDRPALYQIVRRKIEDLAPGRGQGTRHPN